MRSSARASKRSGTGQRAEKRARTALLAGPLGQAAAAHARGDGFFEVWIRVTDTTSSSSMLADIERVGWRLEHAGYAFDSGVPVAIYLFRREQRALHQLRTGQRTAPTLPRVTATENGQTPPLSRRKRPSGGSKDVTA